MKTCMFQRMKTRRMIRKRQKLKRQKVNKLSAVEQQQMQLMEDIEHKTGQQGIKTSKKVEEAEEPYCTNLACDLCKCRREGKCMIKLEINHILLGIK